MWNSPFCRVHWSSPWLVLQCSPGGSLGSRAPFPHDSDIYWGICACRACLKHLWCFLCQGQRAKDILVCADFLLSNQMHAVCVYVCLCGVALYLSTLNLGKWMEFLMNTVKLMASTKAGSLEKTPKLNRIVVQPVPGKCEIYPSHCTSTGVCNYLSVATSLNVAFFTFLL